MTKRTRPQQSSIEDLLGPVDPGKAAGETQKQSFQELMRKLDPVHTGAVDKLEAYARQCAHEELPLDDGERREYLEELLEGSSWGRSITDVTLPDHDDTPL